jgi:hypothetical protein
VTPRYSVVELHTGTRGSTKTALLLTGPDYGMDGISAVLGDCRKTFILFPPSDYNLSWMRRECHNQGKLVRGLEVLQCGVMAELDSSNAIFIPSGWSHAVFTTEGGFLVSIDCVTKRTVWTFSQYLRYQLYLEVETKKQADCFFLFLDCLEVALEHGELSTASRSWTNIEDLLRKHSDDKWKRSALMLWKGVLENHADVLVSEGCDDVGEVPVDRFYEKHLTWLDTELGGRKRKRE